MALILVQGRLSSYCPTSLIPILPHHTFFACSNLSSSLLDGQVPLDLEFNIHNKETSSTLSRKRLKSCRASTLPHRPFGESHRSRQDVAGRGAIKPELNPLKQSKLIPASLESTLPSPLVRSTTLEQTSVCNILSPPSHIPPDLFLPHPLDLQLSDSDDEESVRRSAFSLTLAVCAAVQLVHITSALSLWVSRLRLRYFDSPFTYREVSMRSRLGRVGIFWDIENCPIPGSIDAQMVVKQMHKIGTSFGSIQCLRAYGKLEYLTRQAPILLSMGVELCPVPDGKESADKAIIMDALLFAFDHKPCPDAPPVDKVASQGSQGDGIVLVTGDRGFSALLRELSNRQMTTVVIGNGHQKIPPILAQAADFSVQWDEMMETSDFETKCNEKCKMSEDQHFEIGRWEASSSCNVLLKYESQEMAEEEVYPDCDDSLLEEGDTRDEDIVETHPELEFSDTRQTEKGQNVNLLNMATLEGSDGLSARSHLILHDNNFSGNGLPLFEQHQNLDSVPHVYGTKYLLEPATGVQRSLCPTISPDSMGKDERQRQIGLRFKTDELGILKKSAPVGGRVRILRHLRCEVAYVIEKHCKGKPKAALEFEQFELLYELEMGHTLVSSHYGFASLKSLLQSMPDIVALRSISPVMADWRIYPHVKRNGEGRKSRTNFSRQDLRCILYKILHSVWPLGIPKEHLSSEHCKLTGRPLVLVAYEYWKLGDLIQSMGDMLYIDVKNKHVYLVDGAPEPQGLHGRENNGWN